MNKLEKLLGANLRRLRRAEGLTQAQLATAIGRSIDLVSRMERGEAAPSFETLSMLCRALKIPPAVLFGGEATRHSSEPARAELERLTSTMNEREIAWTVDLVRVALARPSAKARG